MTEEGIVWLGAALWLQQHGCRWIVEQFPEAVVPLATELAKVYR